MADTEKPRSKAEATPAAKASSPAETVRDLLLPGIGALRKKAGVKLDLLIRDGEVWARRADAEECRLASAEEIAADAFKEFVEPRLKSLIARETS